MKATKHGLLQLLAILIAVEIVSGLASVNVTRLASDTFTNPNRTAVGKCRSSSQGSSFQDTCKRFDSTDTRALCSSHVQCCELCECQTGYPTYLPHLGKCLSLSELNVVVFGQGSNGCGQRLEVKGKGGRDDDDDDDDDDNPKHKDVCKVKPWNPPVIDFQSTSNPKIKFCSKKDIDYCDFDGVIYSGFVGWKNVTNFTQTFWELKDKKDIVFQWNTAKASYFNGNVIIINFSCKQKKRNSCFSACFIFKSAGTQIVISPKPTTTTTTVTTTRYTVTTTTKLVTIATTTANHTTTKLTTTKTTQQTTKATASKPSTTGPKSTTTQKGRETTSPRGTKTSHVTTSASTKPTEPTESTEPTEPGGTGKLSGNSGDGRGRGATVTIVVAVCGVVLAAAVVCIMATWYLRKRRARKEISSLSENGVHFEKPTSEQGFDDHIYEGQNSVYQLLERDGKSVGGHWEPPAYQGLAKRVTEGTWSEGEVYTNPVMYQDLKKNDTTSKENLPAYHPLLKQHQTTTADTPGYEYGYLVLTGEHGKMENTAEMSEKSPYYFKLEEHDKVEGTADTNENPYYYKLEQ